MSIISKIKLPAWCKKQLKIKSWLAYTYAALVILLLLDMSRMPQEQVSAKVLLFSIRQYQHFVSPNLKGIVVCKFQPTCSHYGYTSIEWYGSFWGTGKTISRLLRCSPWTKQSGWDPP